EPVERTWRATAVKRRAILCYQSQLRTRDPGPARLGRRARARSVLEAHAVSRVGVVILTHNRVDEVAATVARMRALPERPPLVVIDNGGRDETAVRLARDFPGVEVLRLPDNVGAAG